MSCVRTNSRQVLGFVQGRGKRFVCVMRVWSKKATMHACPSLLSTMRTLPQLIYRFSGPAGICMHGLESRSWARIDCCQIQGLPYRRILMALVWYHTRADKKTAWA
jgi:hypothetical protein